MQDKTIDVWSWSLPAPALPPVSGLSVIAGYDFFGFVPMPRYEKVTTAASYWSSTGPGDAESSQKKREKKREKAIVPEKRVAHPMPLVELSGATGELWRELIGLGKKRIHSPLRGAEPALKC